ncbi:MAG: helix-hairpin-helix domain-containing protein [Candidatus Aminicenantia bacterium]
MKVVQSKKRKFLDKWLEEREIIKNLQTLPNIGPVMAEKLYLLGIKTPEQMKKSNPEELYERLQDIEGKVDRCVLYIFRGAILNVSWWKCKDLPKKKKKDRESYRK